MGVTKVIREGYGLASALSYAYEADRSQQWAIEEEVSAVLSLDGVTEAMPVNHSTVSKADGS
jgi:hypothetical protein